MENLHRFTHFSVFPMGIYVCLEGSLNKLKISEWLSPRVFREGVCCRGLDGCGVAVVFLDLRGGCNGRLVGFLARD